MSFLSRERVTNAIQALLMFLNISKQTDSIGAQEVENLKSDCIELMEQLATESISGSKGVFELNSVIGRMNHSLSAPYPSLQTDSFENFVKGEVVAFEHYLNQELKANHLTIQDEVSLFNESLSLWEQIGTSVSAEDGASKLQLLVEKLNQLLPDDERYP